MIGINMNKITFALIIFYVIFIVCGSLLLQNWPLEGRGFYDNIYFIDNFGHS